KQLNIYVTLPKVSHQDLLSLQQTLGKLTAVLGIKLSDQTKDHDLTEQVEKLIAQRNQARQQQDFAQSDAIRDQLKAKGILLEDTTQGKRWKFANE
ncbi:cysteine--tRNA ligase, partial [Leuconostoc mesenteroides]|uniref:CysS/YqeB C-terminal domain-containing protein n=1 Tax=Leuconostoc mesenteroides TaxID=1245 RepID=UPI003F64E4E4|nr:cysteine--tRNA ligase [Leuconostoc mesenteroides]